jgi:hypothetical protein
MSREGEDMNQIVEATFSFQVTIRMVKPARWDQALTELFSSIKQQGTARGRQAVPLLISSR